MKFIIYAHCRMCGNLAVQRIASKHGEGSGRLLWRLLHLPAYRCDPCRNRFFSIFPRKNTRTLHERPVTDGRPASP